MEKNAIEILFGNYRRKILVLLLLRPGEQFHVREIARLTGIPAGSLHRELKLLADSGLLLRLKSGNQVYYQANQECQIYPELAGLFRKTAGLADVIRDALGTLTSKVKIAFVFGSIAQGTAKIGSDIDLFLVGEVTFAEVVSALAETHQQLGREINPVIMTRTEFQNKSTTDPFVMRVLSDQKIYVRGNQDDLGQLVADRATEGTHGNR